MKENGRKNGTLSPCAACKLLRRRCAQDCVFAPYFPADEPQKFASVHKVFGASNVNKILQVHSSPSLSLSLYLQLNCLFGIFFLYKYNFIICSYILLLENENPYIKIKDEKFFFFLKKRENSKKLPNIWSRITL